METKCIKEKMEVLRVRMEFEGMFVVDAVGHSGGLALFWKERNVVEIQNYTRKHISAVVYFSDRSKSWRLTGFYGNPDWTKRYESWTLLRHLKLYEPDAWLCIGDFNEIIDQTEKWGGVFRSENQMMQFRLALEECGLSDLGYRGSKFTWTNRRHDGDLIKERLDRAVANEAWCRLQTMREVQVLAGFKSDHLPLCVQLGDGDTSRWFAKKKFKIEASWMHDDDYLGVVRDAWTEVDSFDHGGDLLQEKLNRCQTKLKSWSFRKFGNDEKELKEKTKRLEELQQEEGAENWEEVLQIQDEIDAILEREDTKWKQRSKQNWYQNGDRNTSFFHAWVDHRRRINQIRKIEDEEGHEWKKIEDISKAFIDFYKNLFSAGNTSGIERCLAGLNERVTDEMNAELLEKFTEDEISTALGQMHPLKSPGPDGFAACFYQKSWDTVKREVCSSVLGFLNNGNFDSNINSTYIALVPKKKNPSKLTDYRPISLCNVIYKICAKVLANRLKKVLPHIISHNQSAFIPGRLITDNILVAFEALHTMSGRMKGRVGYMALKLDMSKAYDRVEWDFLEAVMKKLGFCNRWIQLTMTCVRTVSYSILINMHPYGFITPSRGIRQGDPLSPYFFILCAEGLSSLLQMAEREGRVSGLPIVRGGGGLN
jgi:hypothetical protein